MTKNTQAIAVVTGAASGLGLAVCKLLGQNGAHVVAVDVRNEPSEKLQASLTEYDGHYLVADVSQLDSWNQVTAYLDGIDQEQPGVDYLHLNAGIQIAPPEASLSNYRFQSMDIDNYRRMMGVNVDGVVFGLHNLLPRMKSGGGIVVTSSLAGITPYDVDPLYAMSKHAVSGLVRSLVTECAEHDVVINALCPGGIDTNIIPHDQKGAADRMMTPDHVATEVLGLLQSKISGKTWAKVSENKPAWIVRAPGDRDK